MVAVPESLGPGCSHELGHQGPDGHRDAGLTRGVHGDAKVLVMQVDAEPRIELARQHGGAFRSSTRLPARPPDSTSRASTRSTSHASRKTNASATSSSVPATIIWLAALTVCPAPDPPTCTTVVPRLRSTGRARAKADAGPPTMIDKVPSIAPCSPPETGASRTSMPRSFAFSGDTAGGMRLHGAHVDEKSARPQVGENTVGSQDDRLHVGGVGEHRDSDVRLCDGVGGRARRPPPDVDERRQLFPAPVVPCHCISGANQADRHGAAHDPQSDKGDRLLRRPFRAG